MLELGLPVVYVNMLGGQDELVFDGNSFVMDAAGTVVMRAPPFEEGLYLVEFERVDGVARAGAGAVAPELGDAESVYRALVLGVRDYVGKHGFPGVVMGLSGGIDSALTLAIAVDALGADRVHAVMMPSPYTSQMSLDDARAQAEFLGVKYSVLPDRRHDEGHRGHAGRANSPAASPIPPRRTSSRAAAWCCSWASPTRPARCC